MSVEQAAPLPDDRAESQIQLARALLESVPVGRGQPADQLALCLVLEARPEGVSPGELLDILKIPQSTLSGLLSRTVKSRHASSDRHPCSGRVRVVRLTPYGIVQRRRARWRQVPYEYASIVDEGNHG